MPLTVGSCTTTERIAQSTKATNGSAGDGKRSAGPGTRNQRPQAVIERKVLRTASPVTDSSVIWRGKSASPLATRARRKKGCQADLLFATGAVPTAVREASRRVRWAGEEVSKDGSVEAGL